MFGYKLVSKKKEKKKKEQLRREREGFEAERRAFDAQRPGIERENEALTRQQAAEDAALAKQERRQAEQEGREDTKKFFGQDIAGLTPAERQAIQYEANQQVNREMEGAQKRLLGEQGRRGVGGKSGVAFAQQQELQRAGQEAKGQSQRDINRLNADLQLKKLAAIFTGGKGEAAQTQLDKQLALDELRHAEERRRGRAWEDNFNRLFSRI